MEELPLVPCSAVRTGLPEVFHQVLERLQQTTPDVTSSYLAQALTCSQRPWLLQSAMQMALNPNHTLSDFQFTIFRGAAESNIGRPLVWDYLATHWDDSPLGILKWIVLQEVVKGFHTAYQIEQVRWLLSVVSDPDDVAIVHQALQTVETNNKHMENNQAALQAWLDRELQL